MARYDLLLQGGMIYDPCAGVLETGDIAVKDGARLYHFARPY